MRRPLAILVPTLAGIAAVAGALLVSLGPVEPAGAVPDPTLPSPPKAGAPPSEIVLSALGPGHGVSGLIGVGSVSDPTVAYPPPTAGFVPLNESFAGVILASPGDLQMYCINILTPTGFNYGYNLGTWDGANVANVGFVALLLNNYYPNNTAQPPIGANGINNTADQAAAVQAAIWYFSDNYVLTANSPLQSAVASIVNTVRVQPPLPSPTPPSLQIAPPSSTTGDLGSLIGPYVITTNDPVGATVSAVGATMFADAGGSSVIPNGTLVPTGTPIWLGSSVVGSATLTAVAQADVPSGNVYLYSGNIDGVIEAQKLILAESVTVTANATAPAEFTQPTPTTPTTPTSDPTTSAVAPTTTSSATSAVVAPTATGSLPQTGSNATRPAYAAALLLIAVGCFAYAFGRAVRNTT